MSLKTKQTKQQQKGDVWCLKAVIITFTSIRSKSTACTEFTVSNSRTKVQIKYIHENIFTNKNKDKYKLDTISLILNGLNLEAKPHHELMLQGVDVLRDMESEQIHSTFI